MDDIGIGLSGLALLFVVIGLRVPIGVALIGVSFAGLYVLLGAQLGSHVPVAWIHLLSCGVDPRDVQSRSGLDIGASRRACHCGCLRVCGLCGGVWIIRRLRGCNGAHCRPRDDTRAL